MLRSFRTDLGRFGLEVSHNTSVSRHTSLQHVSKSVQFILRRFFRFFFLQSSDVFSAMEVGDDSESEGSFAGFNPEDITLHEANNESDINVSESDVSSVHTSDLSDWEDRLTDVDEFDVDNRPRDIHGWTPVITPIHCEDFQVRTGPNITTFDVSTGSQLDFFLSF
eukprot:TRINITY_DN127037_c0_g1_i4.p1 TRINITY_DN127037_c0_g1~~TRINITY_DN127037_c0_g1_i4.p1  ORF type:complete len:166 (+),score=13.44 TRINITY_DN127037_c0_g1_i4:68-565(+)